VEGGARMMESSSPSVPPYPLHNAFTRFFNNLAEAAEHYLRYQYARCQIYELNDGRALMVVHA
jgi:hypothetical protein